MRKTILMIICIFSIFLVCCGKSEENNVKFEVNNTQDINSVKESNNVQKISVDSNAPKYKLFSRFSDWEAEFAITYTDVKMVPYLHALHTLTVVEIVNTGENPINMGDLKLKNYILRDNTENEGAYLFEFHYPLILKSGEKGYLFGYASAFDIWSEITDLELELNFDSEVDTVYREGEDVLYSCSVSDVTLRKNENNNMHLMGKVTNDNAKDLELVYVQAVLLDKNEKPLCVLFDLVDIKAGETVEFDASATTVDAIQESDVASWRIEAVRWD